MIDVLVVGAGPTGLTLGVELARRAISVRVVEKNVTPSPDHSRALAVQARTLELYEWLGLADEAERRGKVNPGVNFVRSNGKTARIPLVGFEGMHSRWAQMLMLPQSVNEEMLAARLAKEGVQPERGVELRLLTQDEDGVTCELVHGDGRVETVRARFVVGCDGSHSMVRSTAKIAFEGDTYLDHCLLGEGVFRWDFPDGELLLAPGRRGVMAAFPVPGKAHLFRVIAILPHAHPGGRGELTQQEFVETVRELVPGPVEMEDPVVLTRYQLHHRVAESFRSGRLFLAGDAAHIHSPAGGQGMNTGIQDAFNLGWKLAAVCKGELAPEQLDSYEAERRKVALRLVSFTDRAFGVMAGHGAAGNVLRLLAPRLATRIFKLPALQRALFSFVSQLRVRYADGPLVRQVGTPPKHAPRAGERAPDVEVQGERLYARMGTSAVLLAVGSPATQTLVELASRAHAQVLHADEHSAAAEVYGRSTLLLIRPDGYIGIRVDPAQPAELERAMLELYPAARTSLG